MAKPLVKQHLAAIRQLFDYRVTSGILPSNPAGSVRSPALIIGFSGYTGGSVDHWLGTKGFKLEKDARDASSNFPLPKMHSRCVVRSQGQQRSAELYVFFGKERISSGSVFIPDSHYFIGLFLCDDGQVDFPYKGQSFIPAAASFAWASRSPTRR